jgi:hypothetical protein
MRKEFRVREARDGLMWALLVLFSLAAIGMLLSSWELVLYSSLLAFGALIAISPVLRGRRSAIGVPVAVTALLLLLFGALHVMGIDEPSGTGTFLGWDPMTALYLFGVGAAFVLVSLVYALTDRPTPTVEESTR